MSRKTMSVILALTVSLLACASLPTLPGAATAPPSEAASEAPPAEALTPAGVPTAEAGSAEAATEQPSLPTNASQLDPITSDVAASLFEIKRLDAPGVRFIAINPTGDVMASAEGSSIVLYHNMPFPDSTLKLDGHTGNVNALSWSPDGSQLASASDDGSVRVWDTSTGQQVSKFDLQPGGISSVAWSPDGISIAIGDNKGNYDLIDPDTGEVTQTVPLGVVPISAIAWSSDGTFFVTATFRGSSSPGVVQLWDTSGDQPAMSGKPVTNYLAAGPSGVAWSPVDNVVAWVNNADGAQASLWSTDDNNTTTMVFKGQTGVDSVAWASDGSLLATGGLDHNVRVWNTSNGSSLVELKGHTDTVHTVAWSPDGTYLVSASWDNTIRIWGAVSP